MIIIGAGYSGLLAGVIFKDAMIYEVASEKRCEFRHQAVFRMKTNKIGEYLGIPFKKVVVYKSIWYAERNVGPTPDMIHMYSKKVSGMITSRSIGNIESEVRYIPPENFYNLLLRESSVVSYDHRFKFAADVANTPVISTIPLSVLLKIKDPNNDMIDNFSPKPIYVTKFHISNCDSYATVYYPSELQKVYRSTLNGNKLIIESMEPIEIGDSETGSVLNSLGLEDSDVTGLMFSNQSNAYGKIAQIDNQKRGKIILDLTLKHNIYSLGRYATWRPKVMLEDVMDDIFVIRRLIEQGPYSAAVYNQN